MKVINKIPKEFWNVFWGGIMFFLIFIFRNDKFWEMIGFIVYGIVVFMFGYICGLVKCFRR